ncbi:VQ motif-containing protein 10-like [Ipomoea triloba]|uniref:VQ motif-containing protein 10-like n=1 Tax=Ipomoea triloba TaxID=35885 RepID=UPI00125DCD86|nr:VQ motif-containing protein 10-like [Ipomoea triloba]
MAEESNGYAVKVVIINTEYIETDARSFKAVVQRLTGKESNVAAAAKAGFNGQRKVNSGGGISTAAKTSHQQLHLATAHLAFNDFDCDRLLFNKEMSPLDELYALYAQS